MNQADTLTMAVTPAAKKRGFWQRRLLDPLMGFLAQGVTPRELSRAISLAVLCGLFPFLGATTLLTLGVGFTLHLNQPGHADDQLSAQRGAAFDDSGLCAIGCDDPRGECR